MFFFPKISSSPRKNSGVGGGACPAPAAGASRARPGTGGRRPGRRAGRAGAPPPRGRRCSRPGRPGPRAGAPPPPAAPSAGAPVFGTWITCRYQTGRKTVPGWPGWWGGWPPLWAAGGDTSCAVSGTGVPSRRRPGGPASSTPPWTGARATGARRTRRWPPSPSGTQRRFGGARRSLWRSTAYASCA